MVWGMEVMSVQFRVKGFLTRPVTVNCQSASVSGVAFATGGIELYAKPVNITSTVIIVIPAKVFFNLDANCVSL